jgi:hypothetical protein
MHLISLAGRLARSCYEGTTAVYELHEHEPVHEGYDMVEGSRKWRKVQVEADS